MRFLYPLVNSGINFETSPSEKSSVQLANLVTLALFLLGIMLFVTYYIWYGWSIITGVIPFIATPHGLKRIASIKTDSNDPKLKEYYIGINKSFLKLDVDQQLFSSFATAIHGQFLMTKDLL
jgi:hypothetical protein